MLRKGNKKGAMLALQKKRYQETTLARTEGQHANIEEMINSIEWADLQAEVFDALKNGKDVLESINEEMKLEDVERLMEETAEAIEYQNHVSLILGEALTEEDDAVVEDELRELEAAALMDEIDSAPEVPASAFTAPEPVAAEEEEDEEEDEEARDAQKEPAAAEKAERRPVVVA